MRLAKLKHKIPVLIIGAICILGIWISMVRMNVMHSGLTVLEIKGIPIPVSSINGCLQALSFLICVFMTCISYKRGGLISFILTAFTTLYNVFGMVKSHSLAPLPGVINGCMFLIVIAIISGQFRLLEKENNTDYVTGLMNMRGFLHRMEYRFADKTPTTLVYFRIGNFRVINDDLGHEVGNELLRLLGERIVSVVGKRGLVCKTGGTEFAVVIDRKEDEKKLCEEIFEIVAERFEIPIGGVKVNCYPELYAGVAKYPDDTDDLKTLVKYVDIALFHASKLGAGRVFQFNQEIKNQIFRQSSVEGIIKECLENDYFYLVYQPQYDIQDGSLRGFETLIRIKSPGDTSVGTAEFISVAEKSDLILKIDDYVLRRAMEEFADRLNRYEKQITLSINVSANSMAREDFAEKVKMLLEQTGFPSRCLELEITEYSFAESQEHTIQNIEELKKLGIKIALDDFGTGYTSLAQLIHLPIDLLKIDKSLVDGIESNTLNRDFISAVIYMGHLMECDVVSEGVENQEQIALLKEQNCDYGQGFVLNRPLQYEVALGLLD